MTDTDPEGATLGTATVSTADRIAGGLLGVHAGDSLGATHEFRPWEELRHDDPSWRLRDIIGGGAFSWSPGAATDDTDLTRCVLDSYLPDGEYDLTGIADAMRGWMDALPPDIGHATRAGLSAYAESGDPRDAGAGVGSCGNGSLMRCIPTGLLRADPAVRAVESREISAITHDDPICQDACVAYTTIVANLLAGAPAADSIAHGLTGASPGVADAIRAGLRLDLADLAQNHGNPYGGSGYVLHSLSLAVAALADPRSFEAVICDVVHLGGDTDTNAAIAGGLVGARDGATTIPDRWVSVLQYGAELAAAATAIDALRA